MSDHYPILFQMDGVKSKKNYPFIFNNMWLQNDDFCLLIMNIWQNVFSRKEYSAMDALVSKLKYLKKEAIIWEK